VDRERARWTSPPLPTPLPLSALGNNRVLARQVTRTDGSWTYGKVMDYDVNGDTYSVMTRAGPKHMVEREAITDDIVVNPSDGSCAQQ
jgi:hypothetical protein